MQRVADGRAHIKYTAADDMNKNNRTNNNGKNALEDKHAHGVLHLRVSASPPLTNEMIYARVHRDVDVREIHCTLARRRRCAPSVYAGPS